MTEHAATSGQTRNSFYTNPHLVTPHYSNGNGVNYFYPSGQVQYPSTSGSYPIYHPNYLPSASTTTIYMPSSSSMSLQYPLEPPRRPSNQPQSRTLSLLPHQSAPIPAQRSAAYHQGRLTYGAEMSVTGAAEIESQDSINEDTMLSEPIIPELDGYPVANAFDGIVREYAIERTYYDFIC